MSDNLFPQLEPFEQVLYYRLYRLSHGFSRNECIIGTPALARVTGIKHTALFTTIKKLENRGLVERLGQVVLGAKGGQGNRYRVNLPVLVTSTLAVRATRDVRRARDVPGTPGGHMKEIKENHETPAADAPAKYHKGTIETLRAIARTYNGDDVRTRLRQWFEAERREVDEGMIDEAIGEVRT